MSMARKPLGKRPLAGTVPEGSIRRMTSRVQKVVGGKGNDEMNARKSIKTALAEIAMLADEKGSTNDTSDCSRGLTFVIMSA